MKPYATCIERASGEAVRRPSLPYRPPPDRQTDDQTDTIRQDWSGTRNHDRNGPVWPSETGSDGLGPASDRPQTVSDRLHRPPMVSLQPTFCRIRWPSRLARALPDNPPRRQSLRPSPLSPALSPARLPDCPSPVTKASPHSTRCECDRGYPLHSPVSMTRPLYKYIVVTSVSRVSCIRVGTWGARGGGGVGGMASGGISYNSSCARDAREINSR